MKFPFLQFFTGDWLKDPQLSICSPATRGVWIDLLCAMHESGRSGMLRGTTEQLARTARCSTTELAQALTELQTTGAADVTERNNAVTVSNRRMQRESNAREQTRTRVSRHRGNADVTPPKRLYEGGSDSEIELPKGFPETVEYAVRQADFVGCGTVFATKTWNKAMSRNGTDARGQPIRSFRHHLAAEWAYEQERTAKRPAGVQTNGAMTVVHQKEFDRVTERMKAIRSSYADHQTWDDQDREEFQKLVARKKELKALLGITV